MKPITTLRVALYLASDDGDCCLLSPQQQEDELQDYLEERGPDGWTLEARHIYCDTLEEKDTHRPGLTRLLYAAAGGHIDLVLVHRLDRLAPSAAGLLRIIGELDARDVAVVSVNERFDTRRHDHRLTLSNYGTLLALEGGAADQ